MTSVAELMEHEKGVCIGWADDSSGERDQHEAWGGGTPDEACSFTGLGHVNVLECKTYSVSLQGRRVLVHVRISLADGYSLFSQPESDKAAPAGWPHLFIFLRLVDSSLSARGVHIHHVQTYASQTSVSVSSAYTQLEPYIPIFISRNVHRQTYFRRSRRRQWIRYALFTSFHYVVLLSLIALI